MSLYHHQEIWRDRPAGDGINGVQVQARRFVDNSTINSAVTSATVGNIVGLVQYYLADAATSGKNAYELHPGPYYTEGTHEGETKRRASSGIQTTGPLDLTSQFQLNKAIGNGVIRDPAYGLDELEVTADGANRVVTVDSGAGCVEGLPFWSDRARVLTIAANSSGQTRIDTIVIEMVPPGEEEEGRCILRVVQGTAGAGAPTLTQDTTLWQEPLADVEVGDGVSVIGEDDLTDRRSYVEGAVGPQGDQGPQGEQGDQGPEGPPGDGSGDVLGPATNSNNGLVLFDGTNSKTIKQATGSGLVSVASGVASVTGGSGNVAVSSGTISVQPYDRLIAYYQAAYNPPSINAGAAATADFTVTFAAGFSAIATTDRIEVYHLGLVQPTFAGGPTSSPLVVGAVRIGDSTVRLHIRNVSSTMNGVDAPSATLMIRVYRLVS